MKIVESPFSFNVCSMCISVKKLLGYKKFKEKSWCRKSSVERVGRESKNYTQQLNKRIMPNPAVN